jgi:hypothetical protein
MTTQNLDLLTVEELASALKVKVSWIYGESRKRPKRTPVSCRKKYSCTAKVVAVA